MKYRSEIDGLRAVAVVPVILFHAGFEVFRGGFAGVDIFFVISGYLITSIIMSEMEKGKFSILTFYERRARRILPALFFMLFSCLPFAWMWLNPEDMKDFGQSLIAVSTFLSNILFWRETGYFATAAELKPLLHTWSLAVEEQYYIFFPLLLMATWRFGVRWVVGIIVVLFFISLALGHWSAEHHPSTAFFWLHTRAWELFVGVFAAFYLKHMVRFNEGLNPKVHQALSAVGLALVAYSIFVFDKNTAFPGLPALVPTVGTFLIIVFANKGTLVNGMLSMKGFVGIGLISYSAYLWHQPLMVFARHRSLTEPSELLMAILCVVTLVMAYVSWRFVEQPFRVKQTTSRNFVFTSGAVLGALTITIGAAGHVSNGFSDRVDPIKLAVLGTTNTSPKRESCHSNKANPIAPENACLYEDGNAEWAVFGDSHTVELSYALAKELAPRGKAVKHFSFSECGPTHARNRETPCAVWADQTFKHLVDNEKLTNVVMTYRLTQYLFGGHEGEYPAFPRGKSEQERREIWASLIATLEKLVAAGKSVTFVVQAPEVAVPVQTLIYKSSVEAAANKIEGVTSDWWAKRNSYVTERLSEIPSAVKIVDPAKQFCDDTSCYAVVDGKSLYFDDDHMSVHGASFVAREIVTSTGSYAGLQLGGLNAGGH